MIPGRGAAPSELLAVGPPAPRPARGRSATGLLSWAVAGVLGAGVLVAVDQRQQPGPAPVPVVAQTSSLYGVTGQVGLIDEQPLVTLLDLVVTVVPGETGREDSTTRPAAQLQLIDVTARGFVVRLPRRTAPLLLGYVGRFASGTQRVLTLSAEVSVVDCSVEVGAQRTLSLVVQRGNGPVGSVRVRGDEAVVRSLDDLVRRSCRRPRG